VLGLVVEGGRSRPAIVRHLAWKHNAVVRHKLAVRGTATKNTAMAMRKSKTGKRHLDTRARVQGFEVTRARTFGSDGFEERGNIVCRA
jgi:hypothetical protein